MYYTLRTPLSTHPFKTLAFTERQMLQSGKREKVRFKKHPTSFDPFLQTDKIKRPVFSFTT